MEQTHLSRTTAAALPQTLQSERLRLTPWAQEDFAFLARLCGDAQVMRFFPAPLTPEQCLPYFERICRHFAEHGFGFWLVRLAQTGEPIGFTGLGYVNERMPFAPAVEVSWRYLPQHWGRGYATEAAHTAFRHGFDALGLAQIVAFTTVSNLPSQRVMQRLGMRTEADWDFDHPLLPAGHPLMRHCLYRMDAGAVPADCSG